MIFKYEFEFFSDTHVLNNLGENLLSVNNNNNNIQKLTDNPASNDTKQDSSITSPSLSPKNLSSAQSSVKDNIFIGTNSKQADTPSVNNQTSASSSISITICSSQESLLVPDVKGESLDKQSAITKAFDSLSRAASCKSKYSNLLRNDTDLNTELNIEKTHWAKLGGLSMVNEMQIEFSIPPSPSLPFTENFVLQSASRLLLNSFDWIKSSNNAFKLLDIDVQTVLLQKNWFDLFALGMSQCAKSLSLSTILTNINFQFQASFSQGKFQQLVAIMFTRFTIYIIINMIFVSGKIDRRKFLMIKEQLFYLQTFMSECEHLNITSVEYAYLKLISIFDYGKFLLKSQIA